MLDVEPGGARWRFTVGCLRAVVSEPAGLHRMRYPLLVAGVLAAALGWTSTIGYAPLRWAVVGLVSILLTLSWWGRRPGRIGPVGDNRAARLVRTGGYLLVAATFLELAAGMTSHDNSEVQQLSGVPIFTVVLTGYLFGFLAVTAHRGTTVGPVLATGAETGTAAAALWLASVLVSPPIPHSAGATLALLATAMIVAACAVGRRGNTRHRVIAALCAGTIAALLIFVLVHGLAGYGPASLIPDDSAAFTPAERLAQSRHEIVDPYISVLFLGCFLAVLLGISSITAKRPRPIELTRATATAP